MQGIYTYFSETSYVPREYSVAAIYSLVTIHCAFTVSSSVESIVIYINTFRSMCAVPNMAVFWSSLTSCFPGMLLTYFLNNFELLLLLLLLLISCVSVTKHIKIQITDFLNVMPCGIVII